MVGVPVLLLTLDGAVRGVPAAVVHGLLLAVVTLKRDRSTADRPQIKYKYLETELRTVVSSVSSASRTHPLLLLCLGDELLVLGHQLLHLLHQLLFTLLLHLLTLPLHLGLSSGHGFAHRLALLLLHLGTELRGRRRTGRADVKTAFQVENID